MEVQKGDTPTSQKVDSVKIDLTLNRLSFPYFFHNFERNYLFIGGGVGVIGLPISRKKDLL